VGLAVTALGGVALVPTGTAAPPARPVPPPGATASTAPPPTARTPRPEPADRADDWLQVVRRLARLRVSALTGADVGALGRVYRRGSPTGAADRMLVRRLSARGGRVDGLRVTVGPVVVLRERARTCVLRVRQVVSAYRVVDGRGETRGRAPAVEQHVVLVLRRAADERRWRIARITPVVSPAAR
jgi:hypothetical protein